MATLLLIIIYTAFIGLGIPDSLFGTAWPAIYAEFDLPLSFGSFVTVIISCGTVLSSMFSARMIRRFGTNRVSAVSTLMTAAALLGFALSPNLWTMCIAALPLGMGAGAIDVALNNYVAIHYSASHMSFLHCFYGVGVSVSPYILSLVISTDAGWRGGYRTAFALQAVIAVLLFASLPLWSKVHGAETSEDGSDEKADSFSATLKIPGVKKMCVLFITSCAIEWSVGGWGSTFLVEYRRLTADQAARAVMFYYIGITLGRFLSGVIASRWHSWKIVTVGEGILGVAILLMLLPVPSTLCVLGLFLIGLGNGPLFPNFNYLAPESFGSDVSQSVIGVQMASAYVGIMLAPPLCGLIGQTVGMGIFPVYLFVFYAVMLPTTLAAKRTLCKR